MEVTLVVQAKKTSRSLNMTNKSLLLMFLQIFFIVLFELKEE